MAFRYRIEAIDLLQKPQLAQGDQILALPTLVRRLPEPIRRVIGDCPIPRGYLSVLIFVPAIRVR